MNKVLAIVFDCENLAYRLYSFHDLRTYIRICIF